LEKGYNSDILYLGNKFHIQTEDWGLENPFLVSRVFKNGAVVRSIKVGYEEVLPEGLNSGCQAIRLALEVQHNKILDLLVSGKLV